MATYSTNFTALNRSDYAATFALVDYVTGELRTRSCDVPSYALQSLYRRMDGEMRAARCRGALCHLVLADCVSGRVIAEVKCDFGC